ncbi:Hpt domain-containing protein [Massilia sp. H-1]|nr:Hpt domain-containing protein [Massilia sp. H-1]
MDVLSTTFGGNPAKMRKYALLFIESARHAMTQIGEALAQGDMGHAADLAHRLKSSAKAIGAMGFANLCEALETMRDGQDAADAAGAGGAHGRTAGRAGRAHRTGSGSPRNLNRGGLPPGR